MNYKLNDFLQATIGNTAYIIGGFEEEPADYVYSFNSETSTWAEEPKLRFYHL